MPLGRGVCLLPGLCYGEHLAQMDLNRDLSSASPRLELLRHGLDDDLVMLRRS
ncbi:hypothetical protein IT084_10510 [Desulfallas sp. Bu1-1]|nr:hypothetical protein [Desulfallas sp. Bu1-1]